MFEPYPPEADEASSPDTKTTEKLLTLKKMTVN